MRWLYRLRQVWHVLSASPKPEELKALSEVLSPSLLSLFLKMHPSEQVHALTVYRKLNQGWNGSQALCQAALLHDVGKTRHPLSLWERSLIVLANRLFPERSRHWGQGEARGWRRPFVVGYQHPVWGAQLVEGAGASPLVARLIKYHHATRIDGDNSSIEGISLEEQNIMLAQLQAVDSES